MLYNVKFNNLKDLKKHQRSITLDTNERNRSGLHLYNIILKNERNNVKAWIKIWESKLDNRVDRDRIRHKSKINSNFNINIKMLSVVCLCLSILYSIYCILHTVHTIQYYEPMYCSVLYYTMKLWNKLYIVILFYFATKIVRLLLR